MNILPKKSWHVRTKRNIDRVRKDEALAAQQEKELQRRIQLAESEARINFLRGKVQSEGFDFEKAATAQVTTDLSSEGHLNFFKDIEKAERNIHATNPDHEKEKKQEKEEYEKKIGLLTYLGQSSSEAAGSKPWFAESHEERLQLSKESERKDKDAKLKDSMDPMKIMKHYVDLKCGLQENGKKISKLKELTTESERHRLYKKKNSKKAGKTIEEMRAERLKREKVERERALEVLRRVRGEGSARDKSPEVILDDRRRGYNSQYNPHLAKKHQ
ncbi:unnamed protein product [Ixodes hexagonus]